MKLFLTQPGFLSPYGSMGVDITWLIALLATAMFLFGWRKASGKLKFDTPPLLIYNNKYYHIYGMFFWEGRIRGKCREIFFGIMMR